MKRKSTKSTTRPLSLNKQTIRNLEGEQLRDAAGGGPITGKSWCFCPI